MKLTRTLLFALVVSFTFAQQVVNLTNEIAAPVNSTKQTNTNTSSSINKMVDEVKKEISK